MTLKTHHLGPVAPVVGFWDLDTDSIGSKSLESEEPLPHGAGGAGDGRETRSLRRHGLLEAEGLGDGVERQVHPVPLIAGLPSGLLALVGQDVAEDVAGVALALLEGALGQRVGDASTRGDGHLGLTDVDLADLDDVRLALVAATALPLLAGGGLEATIDHSAVAGVRSSHFWLLSPFRGIVPQSFTGAIVQFYHKLLILSIIFHEK